MFRFDDKEERSAWASIPIRPGSGQGIVLNRSTCRTTCTWSLRSERRWSKLRWSNWSTPGSTTGS